MSLPGVKVSERATKVAPPDCKVCVPGDQSCPAEWKNAGAGRGSWLAAIKSFTFTKNFCPLLPAYAKIGTAKFNCWLCVGAASWLFCRA